MKIKTAELEGAALDWAVAKANNESRVRVDALGKPIMLRDHVFHDCLFSRDWSQGGPLIAKHRVSVVFDTQNNGYYKAEEWQGHVELFTYYEEWRDEGSSDGSTPLIAAMRAIVASKLGDEVDVPEDLI